ncbi:MAG: DUF4430 domain-containing protein [Methanomicrobia archaeon]|nr:DUF4430 domain-containing protein [Methanomicrobia archaeon]MCK4433609.1 DUF4430 domain-containing protein [Methanomicrobia archaeon]
MYPQQESEKIVVTLIIDYHGLRENDTYENVKMPEGSTVLDILENKTDVITEGTQHQKRVVSINGILQNPNANLGWVYTINREYIDVCADAKSLNDGDIVKWTLVVYEL